MKQNENSCVTNREWLFIVRISVKCISNINPKLVYLQMSGIWRHHALYKFRTRRRASSLSTDKTGRTCCKTRFDAITFYPNTNPRFGILWSLLSCMHKRNEMNQIVNIFIFYFYLSVLRRNLIFPNVAKIHQFFYLFFLFYSLKLYNVVVVVFVI